VPGTDEPAIAEGNQTVPPGCVGTNRPSFGGNNGSTSAPDSVALSSRYTGRRSARYSSVVGHTIIGLAAHERTVLAAPVLKYPSAAARRPRL